ncbi:MAG: D-alanyl-D-alanine carboxypeptidase [Oscillibacter sp.]|nr:D-alanyl-D-alanine carboxypeptidase [Oscillibacter sp.]
MKKCRILSFFLAFLLAAVLAVPALADYAPPADPDIQAKDALLMDLRTGAKLYGKNENTTLYPASLTKIMTCLLVMEAVDEERLSMDQPITVSSIVRSLPAGSSTAGIKEGEILTVRDLLYCLMVSSANEAADILAEAVAGNVPDFVQAMNQRAAALGCENTQFMNPHGFHDPNHYTTVWDTYLITLEAMKHAQFMTLCDTALYVVPATNLSPERTLHTTNALIDSWRIAGLKNPDVHGVKTGSTDDAGHCLVATGQHGEMRLLSVIMGAEHSRNESGTLVRRSFTETTRLLNWGFENFHYGTILEEGTAVREFPVSLSKTDHVIGAADRTLTAIVPNGLTAENMERVVTPTAEELEAPVEVGQTLGHVVLRYDGVIYGEAELLASTAAERSRWLAFQKAASDLAKDRRAQIAAAAVGGLVVLGVLWKLIFGRQRYRYGQPVSGRGGYRGSKR